MESSESSMDILPQKSADKYNRQYDVFMEWCKKHEIQEYSENVLMSYFTHLSKEYSPSSMWSYYSMLRSTLSANNVVDISEYKSLLAFLKEIGKNHIPKKSKTFSQEEIINFLLNAPDEIYLMIKICVVFGIVGALRNEELMSLKVTDIDHRGTILVVHINKTKSGKSRAFVVTPEFGEKVKPIELFNKYAILRPKGMPHNRFFLNYRNGKCTIQPVGIHTFGSMPNKIANYLHLPEPSLYTGHCFRQTSANLFAYKGDIREILRLHEGWKSDMAEICNAESASKAKKIAKSLSESESDESNTRSSKDDSAVASTSKKSLTYVDRKQQGNRTQRDAESQDLKPITEHFIPCKEEFLTMDVDEWRGQLSSGDEKTIPAGQTGQLTSKGVEKTKKYTAIVAFFKSMADILAEFSPDIIAETQSRIRDIVMEMKGRTKKETAQATDIMKEGIRSDICELSTDASTIEEEHSPHLKRSHPGVADSSIANISSGLDPKSSQVFPVSDPRSGQILSSLDPDKSRQSYPTSDPKSSQVLSALDPESRESAITTDRQHLLEDIPIKKEPLEIKREVDDFDDFSNLNIVRPEYVPDNVRQLIENMPDDGQRLGTYVTTVYNSLRNFLSKSMFKKKLEELVCEIRILDDTENGEHSRIKRIRCT